MHNGTWRPNKLWRSNSTFNLWLLISFGKSWVRILHYLIPAVHDHYSSEALVTPIPLKRIDGQIAYVSQRTFVSAFLSLKAKSGLNHSGFEISCSRLRALYCRYSNTVWFSSNKYVIHKVHGQYNFFEILANPLTVEPVC